MALTASISVLTQAGCSCPAQNRADKALVVSAGDPHVLVSGRADGLGTNCVTLGWSGARVRLRFTGSEVGIRLEDERGANWAVAWIDGVKGEKFRLNAPDGFYKLASGLPQGEHTVEVVRLTECDIGLTRFKGFVLSPGAKALAWGPEKPRKIEIIGDSITSGYGIEVDDPNLHFAPETENFTLSYAGLTVRALEADYLIVSRSGIGMIRNYDGPREGSEHAMPEVFPHLFYLHESPMWNPAAFTPDVICINIGTNDFSTTGCNVEKFEAAYVAFTGKLLADYPKAKLVFLRGPMENGDALKASLEKIKAALEQDAPGRITIFAMSAQGSRGYGADWHPSRAQGEVNAAELTAYLRDLMDWR
jgi:lysophospholipase L1-like esterase